MVTRIHSHDGLPRMQIIKNIVLEANVCLRMPRQQNLKNLNFPRCRRVYARVA